MNNKKKTELMTRAMTVLPDDATEVTPGVVYWKPFEESRSRYFTRFFEAAVCEVNVQGNADDDTVIAFLTNIAETDLDAATPHTPVAADPIPVFGPGFDTRIILHPSVLNDEPDDPENDRQFLDRITYSAIPAYRCEFGIRDSLDETRFRLSKSVDWASWKREPAPAFNGRFQLKSGYKSGGKRLGCYEPAFVDRVIDRMEKDDGFMELENFERAPTRIEHADDHFFVVLGKERRMLKDGGVRIWLRSYSIKGLTAALEELDSLVA